MKLLRLFGLQREKKGEELPAAEIPADVRRYTIHTIDPQCSEPDTLLWQPRYFYVAPQGLFSLYRYTIEGRLHDPDGPRFRVTLDIVRDELLRARLKFEGQAETQMAYYAVPDDIDVHKRVQDAVREYRYAISSDDARGCSVTVHRARMVSHLHDALFAIEGHAGLDRILHVKTRTKDGIHEVHANQVEFSFLVQRAHVDLTFKKV